MFGRLTVAFGRLEGTVDWLLALLMFHTDVNARVNPDIWKAPLSSKLGDVKALVRTMDLPSELRGRIQGFASLAKELSTERRRVVHALVMHEISPPPDAVVSIFRTGLKGGAALDSVPVRALDGLALRIGLAAEQGLALTRSVADLSPAGGDISSS